MSPRPTAQPLKSPATISRPSAPRRLSSDALIPSPVSMRRIVGRKCTKRRDETLPYYRHRRRVPKHESTTQPVVKQIGLSNPRLWSRQQFVAPLPVGLDEIYHLAARWECWTQNTRRVGCACSSFMFTAFNTKLSNSVCSCRHPGNFF